MKNSTHSWDGVFGHGEEVTNALCPMAQATGRLSLYRHLGMEFPVAFNEFTFDQIIVVVSN
ncbi:MAG: hypothetical protein KME50_22970 [Nostoc desertorum CM1-VF14]|jgi:hypothetical protein|nr:hypothetical protein [Nostoc desertorum CM1-VF14]